MINFIFRFQKLYVLFILSLLTGCPATIDVELKNGAGENISVVYEGGFKSDIKIGDVSKENYKQRCIEIIIGDKELKFEPTILPKEYYQTSTFKTRIYATLNSSHELLVFKKPSRDGEYIKLIEGCHK